METTKFIHIGDTHLGYKQYNKIERYNDFLKAFEWILNKGIEEKVDFFIHTGDLFNNSKLDPSTLSDVYYILSNFKDKSEKELGRSIPIIAIEGNHDRPLFSKQSWMSFLADLGLIILLNGKYESELKKVTFTYTSDENKKGSKIKIKNVNIYGLPYFGSITPKLFPMIYDAITTDKDSFNILMMHFGIDGQDKEKKGILLDEDFEKIHEKINYLALGHFHRMYRLPHGDEWIYNPGSTEFNDIRDLFLAQKEEEDLDHGAFLVEIHNGELSEPTIKPIYCFMGETNDPNLIPNRKFVNVGFIDIGEKSLNTFELAIKAVFNAIRRAGVYYKEDDNYNEDTELNRPIITLSLSGKIPYSKMLVNTRELKEQIMKEFDVLEARIFTTFLESELDGISIQRDDKITVPEIEKIVFNSLIEKNELYSTEAESVLYLMLDWKEQLLKKDYNSTIMAKFLKNFYNENFEGLDAKKNENSKNLKLKKKKAKSQSNFDDIVKLTENDEENHKKNLQNEDPLLEQNSNDEEIEVFDSVELEDLGELSEEDLFDDGEDDFD